MSPTPGDTLADYRKASNALQRRLAERTAERDEALAREAAAAEVLQAINSSSGKLVAAFDAVLDPNFAACRRPPLRP